MPKQMIRRDHQLIKEPNKLPREQQLHPTPQNFNYYQISQTTKMKTSYRPSKILCPVQQQKIKTNPIYAHQIVHTPHGLIWPTSRGLNKQMTEGTLPAKNN